MTVKINGKINTMDGAEKNRVRFRFYFIIFIFLCALAIIFLRALQLQVGEVSRLAWMKVSTYKKSVIVPLKRGIIYDRKGHEMAVNIETKSIYALPSEISNKEDTAKSLSQVLNIDYKRILYLLRTEKSFGWIKRKAPEDLTRQVEALSLKGIRIFNEIRRGYPWGKAAGHLLGFVGSDNHGLEGLERTYDDLLRGSEDKIVSVQDEQSQLVSNFQKNSPSHKPPDLFLTIDKDIQFKAQHSIKWAVTKTGANAGQCLVVQPKTGEILAMAAVPEFDPNNFQEYHPHQWRNRPITDTYEPGTAIMPFLLAASLEETSIKLSSIFDCTKEKYKIRESLASDDCRQGTLAVADIMSRNMGIEAIQIGKKLGVEKFREYLSKFGFGHKTGIGLIGEREGSIGSKEILEKNDQLYLFRGYGLTATSLQMAMAMAAFANEGKLMRPYVVKSIISDSGETVDTIYPKFIRTVVSPETVKNITMLLECTRSDEGTGTSTSKFRYAGKLGISHRTDPGTKSYSNKEDLSIFTGFAPICQPEVVILVLLDGPENRDYGSEMVEAVFRDVTSHVLH